MILSNIPLDALAIAGGTAWIIAGVQQFRNAKPKPAKAPESSGSFPVVEKRRVTMTNPSLGHRAIDFVPLDILDAYVRDAMTRWESVSVGDSHDSGPGGDHGPTVIHEDWKTPNA